MASIIKTNEGWRVAAIGFDGEIITETTRSHAEAQAIANIETTLSLEYYAGFESIDGLQQHPSGLSFAEWVKRRYFINTTARA